MMEILENFSLKNHNTFGIDVRARRFVAIHSIEELRKVLAENRGENIFILGGGSNMLLTRDVDALVVHVDLRGKEIVDTDEHHATLVGMAGENWHEFVMFAIRNGLGGLENMSLIPGNVGTTPIQNIGAYGAEIKDTMLWCEALDTETLELRRFSNAECRFGYRDSIFKNEAKGKYVITAVAFRLTVAHHRINTGYGDITRMLADRQIENPTIKDVSEAVIAIRQSKLPDPKVLGNSGSFFKNPVIPESLYRIASQKFPDMPHYPAGDGMVKVPAGWLIEQAGFKGKRFGDAGMHKNQALVLVNYGGASGAELLAVARDVQRTVKEMFGIEIEAEVNIV